MNTREQRLWVREWWADQMREGSLPDLPEELDNDAFEEIWADESRKLAERITRNRP